LGTEDAINPRNISCIQGPFGASTLRRIHAGFAFDFRNPAG
jgi:hypothetical protein